MCRQNPLQIGLFLGLFIFASSAWGKALSSPRIEGRLHNQTSYSTADLSLVITAYCVRGFQVDPDETCGDSTVLVPVRADGRFSIPSISIEVKKKWRIGRLKVKMQVDILFPDGLTLFNGEDFWNQPARVPFEEFASIMSEFTVFEIGNLNMTYELASGGSFLDWLGNEDPDHRLHVLIRVLSRYLMPFSERVSGPVFSYYFLLDSESHFMNPYFLIFKGDFTQDRKVSFEYFVTADGRTTAGDYFRFNNETVMSSDLLAPYGHVVVNPEGCCQPPADED